MVFCLRTAVAGTLLAALLSGQGTPVRLVGSVHAATGGHRLQAQTRGCATEQAVCAGTGLAAPTAPWAGGTAYDPVQQRYWSTNGSQLIAVAAQANGTCSAACAAFNVPGLVSGYVASGLAYSEQTQRLWVMTCAGTATAGLPVLRTLALNPVNPCVSVSTQCILATLPNSDPLGGLALSERNGLVLYAQSSFGGTPATVVFAAPVTAPCSPTCSFALPACGTVNLGPVTGLAFDDSTNTLYATDGLLVEAVPLAMPGCTPLPTTRCCPVGAAGTWLGLELEPSHAVARGSSCLAAACGSCTAMALTAVGDPTLGNGSFALRLANAPAQAVVLPILGRGPATSGVPVLCGLFYPAMPPTPILLPTAVDTGIACLGTVTMALPLPYDLALCDANLCAQMALLCGSVADVGLSHALDLTLTAH